MAGCKMQFDPVRVPQAWADRFPDLTVGEIAWQSQTRVDIADPGLPSDFRTLIASTVVDHESGNVHAVAVNCDGSLIQLDPSPGSVIDPADSSRAMPTGSVVMSRRTPPIIDSCSSSDVVAPEFVRCVFPWRVTSRNPKFPNAFVTLGVRYGVPLGTPDACSISVQPSSVKGFTIEYSECFWNQQTQQGLIRYDSVGDFPDGLGSPSVRLRIAFGIHSDPDVMRASILLRITTYLMVHLSGGCAPFVSSELSAFTLRGDCEDILNPTGTVQVLRGADGKFNLSGALNTLLTPVDWFGEYSQVDPDNLSECSHGDMSIAPGVGPAGAMCPNADVTYSHPVYASGECNCGWFQYDDRGTQVINAIRF